MSDLQYVCSNEPSCALTRPHPRNVRHVICVIFLTPQNRTTSGSSKVGFTTIGAEFVLYCVYSPLTSLFEGPPRRSMSASSACQCDQFLSPTIF
jgi:hypothetical protein